MSETTLVAIRSDTSDRITVGDLPLDVLRHLSDERLLRCPHCSELLMLKAGPIRIHHFAHTNLELCAVIDHEPETDEHRQGKLLLYQQFRYGAALAMLECHLPATDQRADVLVAMPDGQRYALEFQQANNSTERWLERHVLYRGQGVNDIWFLGQVRYQESPTESPKPIAPYDPLPVPRNDFEAASGLFRVRELEKAILSAEPMLYYLDPSNGSLTILLVRDVRNNTLRAYRYRLPLSACLLGEGRLWTPLDPLLDDYHRYRAGQR